MASSSYVIKSNCGHTSNQGNSSRLMFISPTCKDEQARKFFQWIIEFLGLGEVPISPGDGITSLANSRPAEYLTTVGAFGIALTTVYSRRFLDSPTKRLNTPAPSFSSAENRSSSPIYDYSSSIGNVRWIAHAPFPSHHCHFTYWSENQLRLICIEGV